MRLLLGVLRQEWRLQWRTGRLRMAALVYLGFAVMPCALVAWLEVPNSERLHGPTTYLGQLLILQPLLTALLAALVAGNRSDASSLEELWCPLASASSSSAGWMVRRWLAMLSLVLPLSLLPQLVAVGFGWFYAGGLPSLATVGWTWLLRIAPVALLVSALWLAMVTLTGGELAAGVATLVLSGVVPGLANRLATGAGFRLGDPLSLLGIDEARVWFLYTSYYLSKPESRREHPGFVATEAPFDPRAGWEQLAPQLGLLAAGVVLAFALALFFTRRTRRDHRPLVVSESHPLRNLIALANGWRGRYAPGAGHSMGEKLLLIPALVLAMGCATHLVYRQLEWKELATRRHAALTDESLVPMSPAVEPEDWRVDGEIHTDGGVATKIVGAMVHRGGASVSHLAFSLNPGLRILRLASPDRGLEVRRSWDRLLLHLDRPLVAGERIGLEIELEGVPMAPDFGLANHRRGRSFAQGFERQATARFASERHDFSRGRLHPSISARSVQLQPGDLLPVPRYTPWTLSPPPSSPGELGRYVPAETTHPTTRLTIDLEAPPHWLLADSCAHLRPSGTVAGRVVAETARVPRLTGSCSVALGRWVVLGGEHELFVGEGGGAVAILPAHRERGAGLLASLDQVLRLSDRAWPSLPPLDALVVVEVPPKPGLNLTEGLQKPWWNHRVETLHGQLVTLEESGVVGENVLDGKALVASSLAEQLIRRRDLEPTQRHLFRALLESLVLRRMGLDEAGAVVMGPPWLAGYITRPFVETDPFNSGVLNIALPAVFAEVEGRLGSATFYRALDTFLTPGETPPATVKDLFDVLSAESGVALERMYADYFETGSLPKLKLDQVTQERRRDGWRVRGELVNSGTGQVECPVVLKTEVGEQGMRVRVDGPSETEFSFETRSRPVRVLLDPQKTCYRLGMASADRLERVDLGGEG